MLRLRAPATRRRAAAPGAASSPAHATPARAPPPRQSRALPSFSWSGNSRRWPPRARSPRRRPRSPRGCGRPRDERVRPVPSSCGVSVAFSSTRCRRLRHCEPSRSSPLENGLARRTATQIRPRRVSAPRRSSTRPDACRAGEKWARGYSQALAPSSAVRASSKITASARGDRLPPFLRGGTEDQPAPGKTSTPRARNYSASPVNGLLAVANLEGRLLRATHRLSV